MNRHETKVAIGCGVGCLLALTAGMYVGATWTIDEPAAGASAGASGSSQPDPPVFETARIEQRFRETDVASLIRLRAPADAEAVRHRLHTVLWPGGRPRSTPSVVSTAPFAPFDENPRLQRIDRLTVAMDHGLDSVVLRLVPDQPNGHLVLFHEGHISYLVHPPAIELMNALVRRGYTVMAFNMILVSPNARPVVRSERFGRLEIGTHDHMPFLPAGPGHPIRFFLEPVLAILDQASTEGHASVTAIGFSGGGWTITLASALDARIALSYEIAGTAPFFLRSDGARYWGDYEQLDPTYYEVANYLEHYVLAALGPGQRHVQILNTHDPCCFFAVRAGVYDRAVQDVVARLGQGGQFSVVADDTEKHHDISAWTIQWILDDLRQAQAGQR